MFFKKKEYQRRQTQIVRKQTEPIDIGRIPVELTFLDGRTRNIYVYGTSYQYHDYGRDEQSYQTIIEPIVEPLRVFKANLTVRSFLNSLPTDGKPGRYIIDPETGDHAVVGLVVEAKIIGPEEKYEKVLEQLFIEPINK